MQLSINPGVFQKQWKFRVSVITVPDRGHGSAKSGEKVVAAVAMPFMTNVAGV